MVTLNRNDKKVLFVLNLKDDLEKLNYYDPNEKTIAEILFEIGSDSKIYNFILQWLTSKDWFNSKDKELMDSVSNLIIESLGHPMDDVYLVLT